MEVSCSEVAVYSGEVCKDVFTSLQTCLSGRMSPPPALNVPSLIDQQSGERDVVSLVNALSALDPNPQCMEAIKPFLCVSVFKLCDSSNQLHTVLREDCLALRDDVCADIWDFFDAGVLPVCENLPSATNDCTGKSNIIGSWC